MQMQRLLDDERAARESVERLAREQAALRRIATLVAELAPSDEIFAAVAEQAARLHGAESGLVIEFDADGSTRVAGSWGPLPHVGARLDVSGEGLTTAVRLSGESVRLDGYEGRSGQVMELVREFGIKSSVGAPIMVERRMWGMIAIFAHRRALLPAHSEQTLMSFGELVGTAIANAESRAQLMASRARIVTAADEERGRVVRDLHDGAQQHLVHAVVTLKLARGALTKSDANTSALLDDALQQAEEANVELRELAHGILPSALRRGGLRAGVEAVVSRMSLPVSVDVSDERLPAGIESTAYFVVSEALTNVVKHANANSAEVTARVERGVLRVEIVDDGVGGLRRTGISGLSGLEDRVSALEGSFIVESPPGKGTRVRALLPLPDRD